MFNDVIRSCRGRRRDPLAAGLLSSPYDNSIGGYGQSDMPTPVHGHLPLMVCIHGGRRSDHTDYQRHDEECCLKLHGRAVWPGELYDVISHTRYQMYHSSAPRIKGTQGRRKYGKLEHCHAIEYVSFILPVPLTLPHKYKLPQQRVRWQDNGCVFNPRAHNASCPVSPRRYSKGRCLCSPRIARERS